MIKTNAKDFHQYESCCRKWIRFFGLLDWDVAFEHADLGGDTEAQCTFNAESRMATLSLNTEITGIIPLDRLAFHETAELMLADLNELANSRFTTELQIDQARHNVIHTLENSIYQFIQKVKRKS
jgi:hypothetical protein